MKPISLEEATVFNKLSQDMSENEISEYFKTCVDQLSKNKKVLAELVRHIITGSLLADHLVSIFADNVKSDNPFLDFLNSIHTLFEKHNPEFAVKYKEYLNNFLTVNDYFANITKVGKA